MSDAGEIWFRALDNFGRNASRGIEDAAMIYHARQEKLRRSDALMHELSQTLNPATGEPVIDEKAYTEYLNHSGKERATLAGAKLGAMQMQNIYQKSARDAIKTTAQTALATARTENVQTRTQGTQVDIAKKLGLIPNVQPPPTGGQIILEQRAQRQERFRQRKEIADTIANEKPVNDKTEFVNDPQMLLDPNAISYKVKATFGGFKDAPKPDQATHVQLEDGPIFTTKQFQRLQQHAKQWQQLGQAPAPQVNAPPGAMQHLIQNPTPEMKAFFDQKFGKGAADAVIGATQPAAAPSATPDTDTESPEEDKTDTDEE